VGGNKKTALQIQSLFRVLWLKQCNEQQLNISHNSIQNTILPCVYSNTKYLKYDWRNQIRLTKFTPISQQYMLQLVYLCTIFWIYFIYLHIWTTDKKYIHTKTYCLRSFFYTSCMGNAQLSYINIIHAILYIIIHSFFFMNSCSLFTSYILL